MPRYQVVLTAKEVGICPMYSPGDRIVVPLPNVDLESSDKVCAFILAELLARRIKRDREMTCTLREEFANKAEYASEFGIEEGTLLCPRVSTEVSFTVSIETRQEDISVAHFEDFTIRTDKRMIISRLQQIPILSSLSANALFDILDEIKVRRYEAQEIILKKGSVGQSLFILYKGDVEIIQEFKDGMQSIIGRLAQGDCFGEMSLLTGDPVSATIKACTPATVFLISKVTFRKLVEQNPTLGLAFTKLLAQRIKSTNQRMGHVVAAGMVGQLQMIHLPELIQTLTATDCNGILHLSHDADQGKIFFQQGQIIDVTLGEQCGEECFYEMLCWNNGNFRFEQIEVQRERTIMRDPIGLLLEGMRRLDERTRQWKASDFSV